MNVLIEAQKNINFISDFSTMHNNMRDTIVVYTGNHNRGIQSLIIVIFLRSVLLRNITLIKFFKVVISYSQAVKKMDVDPCKKGRVKRCEACLAAKK